MRAAALAGDASLPGALTAVKPLWISSVQKPRWNRATGCCAVNGASAKGLQGKVVYWLNHVITEPAATKDAYDTSRDDGAKGYMRVTDDRTGRDLARPENWFEYEALEGFSRDEYVRLLTLRSLVLRRN